MDSFIGRDFLLSGSTAYELYEKFACQVPIIDYHCHIDPSEIAQNKKFENLTQIWLGGDHYKWRIMRACGVGEEYITGSAGDFEKFAAFAEALPQAIGNPVHNWTHLELKNYFDCDKVLCGETAEEIWTICNEKLQSGMSVRRIIKSSNVEAIVTTDDPVDTLQWHKALAQDASFDVPVFPAWRPDKLMNINKPGFASYIRDMGNIQDIDGLRSAIMARMDRFDECCCKASDHGLDGLRYVPADDKRLDEILKKALSGGYVTHEESLAYKFAMLYFMGTEYARRGWVMELHFGAARNINTKGFEKLGPDTGFDAISPHVSLDGVHILLDMLNRESKLPKTILFSLNPNDNAMLNTICACFQKEGVRGHVQQGPAWWFNDHKDGMERQIKDFANNAVLGCFLGMVTDSRSFLSYSRHEYFRRILCNVIGQWVDAGEYPNDTEMLKKLVQDICYYNTKAYFGF